MLEDHKVMGEPKLIEKTQNEISNFQELVILVEFLISYCLEIFEK